jgi:ribosomal protein L37AE/L43A
LAEYFDHRCPDCGSLDFYIAQIEPETLWRCESCNRSFRLKFEFC